MPISLEIKNDLNRGRTRGIINKAEESGGLSQEGDREVDSWVEKDKGIEQVETAHFIWDQHLNNPENIKSIFKILINHLSTDI